MLHARHVHADHLDLLVASGTVTPKRCLAYGVRAALTDGVQVVASVPLCEEFDDAFVLLRDVLDLLTVLFRLLELESFVDEDEQFTSRMSAREISSQ